MLGKLLKYEIKATSRVFLPLYLVLLLFAGINLLFSSISPEGWGAPSVISMMLYVTILIGTFVTAFIVMIQRFYKNLLKDEGYLMFTLPVKSWHHIVNKLLVSSMWTISSIIVAMLSIFIIASDKVNLSEVFSVLRLALGEFNDYFGASAPLLIIQIIAAILIGLFTSTLMIYTSIAIGHLFQKHKILISVGAYLVLYTICQIVTSIAMLIFIGPEMFSSSFEAIPAFVHNIFWLEIGLSAVFFAAYCFTTNFILSRKLNLE